MFNKKQNIRGMFKLLGMKKKAHSSDDTNSYWA